MAEELPWSNRKAFVYSLLSKNPASNRHIARFVDLAASDQVLDIGCGPGSAVRAVAADVQKAVGVDASPKMVEIARRRSALLENVEFLVGSAEALPFPDDTFTVAWTIQSWHHWNDSLAGLGEVWRVLRPGGTFAVLERKTRGSHGLSESRAAALQTEFAAVGFVETAVTRQGKFYSVSGTVPGVDLS